MFSWHKLYNEMLSKYKKSLEKNKEVYLRIKVRPGAEDSEIKNVMDDDTIKVNIMSPPAKGKANNELVKLLGKKFNVNKENIKIISGAGERLKLLKIIKNNNIAS